MRKDAISSEMIAPELRDALAKVPNFPIRSGLLRSVATGLMKRRRPPQSGDVTAEICKGSPGARIFRPMAPRSKGALLWIHGGGYVIGSASIDDGLCSRIAAELGVLVVSTEYRLAPRHSFPAPLDDCYESWSWLVRHADEFGVDPMRIAIGGMSAGGGLAAGLVQRLADEVGPKPVAQLLMAPMIDDRTAARTELDALVHPVWNNALNRFGWESYLGFTPGGTNIPKYAAPSRRDDLSELPATWIGVGSIELFHDENVLYAQRLEDAGVSVEIRVAQGAPHGFEAWGHETEIGRNHVNAAVAWLKRQIG